MRRSIPLVFAVLLLGACSSQPPVPEDHYYRLLSPAAPADPLPLADGTIFVEQFIADGVYRERALAYVTGDQSVDIRQHHYHFWMDSPSRLLRDQLIDYLRVRSAAPLVTDAAQVPSALNIHGKIRRFDQKTDSARGEVVVALDFRVDMAGKEEPVLLKSYERRVASAGGDIASAVPAYSTALSEIFAELTADIAGVR